MSTSRKVGPLRVRPHIRHGVPTGKWFVDIPASLTGTGQRKRKLFDNQRTALEVARYLRHRLDPYTGEGLLERRKSGLLFCEAVERWRENEELRVATLKKRASTLETDLHRLKPLIAFLGTYDLSAITKRDLMTYQKWRLDEGRKPRTINSEIGTFGLVIRWAVENGYRDDVPKVEQIPAPRKPAVIPTCEETVRVIRALPPRLQPVLWFLAETGCRKGEAFNLTWDCVDEVNGFVEIKSKDGWTPKTEPSERSIPLSPELLKAIRVLPKEGRYVFPGATPDTPINNFRKALASAVATANIRRNGKRVHLTLHAFRKAYATWQAMRGVNESVLQELLGHAAGSRVTKQYYVHPTDEAKRAAVIELPIIEHNGNKNAPDLAISGNKAKKSGSRCR